MTNLFERTLNVLETTRTNFTTVKRSLTAVSDNGILLETPFFGTFRSDNNHCMGSVTDRYVAMQNHQLVELLLQASERLNLDITNGGSLKGGAKVFYQIELPKQFIGKSDIKRQLTALNSHDGSGSICFGSSNTVVVCQNTFNMASKETTKVRHTVSSEDKVKDIVADMQRTIEKDLLLMDTFKRMADVELKEEMVVNLISKLFKVDATKQLTDVHTRTKNAITAFADSLNTEMKDEGKTVWGLFNAVTRYTNHVAAPTETVAKNEFLMLGAGAQMSNMAFNELLAYIDSRTAKYAEVLKG